MQILFADLADGACSFAMVGQGQMGALVRVRPEERRGLGDVAAADLRARENVQMTWFDQGTPKTRNPSYHHRSIDFRCGSYWVPGCWLAGE